eukprot:CAMPEP_0170554644 /NCGR_PEP_ID=MMETSP0211-20121228/12528_1 /TAXON_ID=311385 /ORGANISM="Pseudokeronopsis sp., Strain OXSARD2" /LENGTH=65 /DNA_ID=CAMNT_0010863889 /DNA_START=109 /DNA_END=303 /DNA_ORIENTATION=-
MKTPILKENGLLIERDDDHAQTDIGNYEFKQEEDAAGNARQMKQMKFVKNILESKIASLQMGKED